MKLIAVLLTTAVLSLSLTGCGACAKKKQSAACCTSSGACTVK